MLHPSYADLINVVNSGVEEGEDPVVNSRYASGSGITVTGAWRRNR